VSLAVSLAPIVAHFEPGPAVLAVTVGYVLGSVPVAVLVGRRRGIDPREVGDHNPGYWNVRHHLDRVDSLVVFAGDCLKGAAAAALGVAVADDMWGVPYAAVGAAMVGHAYPVFARFRGGRSVLTFVGGMVVVAPAAAAVAGAAFAVTWLVTRSFAVAARVGVFGFPLAQALLEPKERVAATGALMCFIGLRFAQAAVHERRAAAS
jgi:acyl phosphate:glycerol-3-phosphate acyltransferase